MWCTPPHRAIPWVPRRAAVVPVCPNDERLTCGGLASLRPQCSAPGPDPRHRPAPRRCPGYTTSTPTEPQAATTRGPPINELSRCHPDLESDRKPPFTSDPPGLPTHIPGAALGAPAPMSNARPVRRPLLSATTRLRGATAPRLPTARRRPGPRTNQTPARPLRLINCPHTRFTVNFPGALTTSRQPARRRRHAHRTHRQPPPERTPTSDDPIPTEIVDRRTAESDGRTTTHPL